MNGSSELQHRREANMKNLHVIKVTPDRIEFSDGTKLYSEHYSNCCEEHYLDFSDISLDDFAGLEFDLSSDGFFERVPDYGIALKPIHGHPVRIPGYAYNNGYYSSDLTLVIQRACGGNVEYDITECQEWRG